MNQAKQIEDCSTEIFRQLSDSKRREQEAMAQLEEKDRFLRISVDCIESQNAQLDDYQTLWLEKAQDARDLACRVTTLGLQLKVANQDARNLADCVISLQSQLKEKDKEVIHFADRFALQLSQLSESHSRIQQKDEHLKALLDRIESQKAQLEKNTQEQAEMGELLEVVLSQKALLEKKSALCSICEETAPEVAFVPCGHRMACKTCGSKCKSRCPICRGSITGMLRVYDV